MKVTAKLNNLRISPRKTRLVTDSIKGIDVNDAIVNLGNLIKRSSGPVEKLLKSAVANAENNFGLDRNNLYIYDIQVGEGPTLKRWLPRAFGRATPLLKKSSKINLVLEERIEGKNRKTKEQMEKEMIAERESETKKENVAPTAGKVIEEKKNVEGKGWTKKIFQRKSA